MIVRIFLYFIIATEVFVVAEKCLKNDFAGKLMVEGVQLSLLSIQIKCTLANYSCNLSVKLTVKC